MNRKNLVLSLLLVYSFSTFSAGIPLICIDDAAITQEKVRITKDFAKRDYLAKASYLALAGGTVYFAYKWGFFDYFSEKKPDAQLPAVLGENDNIRPIVAALLKKHHENESNITDKVNWFIKGAKYVGASGFSLLAGIVVQSRWQKFFDYALATPTFDWFYGSHSMLNRIDSLRYHIAHSIDITGAAPQATLDFHYDAIAPCLDTLQKNIKELIAFSEYYFDQIDSQLVEQYNLESAPRYLFNAANDYFVALKDALDAQDRTKALALTDAFRAELTNYNKDCQSFENTAFN